MSDLVDNTEDRFSQVAGHITETLLSPLTLTAAAVLSSRNCFLSLNARCWRIPLQNACKHKQVVYQVSSIRSKPISRVFWPAKHHTALLTRTLIFYIFTLTLIFHLKFHALSIIIAFLAVIWYFTCMIYIF